MVHITVPEVLQWLDATKFDVQYIEVALEHTVSELTLSALSKQFPNEVLTWLDEVTTPDLVRVVISMRYAAAVYRRQYAEVSERMPSYPANLDRWATDQLQGILSGDLDLLDVTAIPADQQPSFYPKDSSGTTNSSGNAAEGPEWAGALSLVNEGDGQKFTMGKVF